GTVVMSGMYGSSAASRTMCRSAITNGRSLNGPAVSTGTTNPSLIRPVSRQARRGCTGSPAGAWPSVSPALLACRGRWQAQLAADHTDRLLHRLVGFLEPALVTAELAQGRAGGCLLGELGPGLVRGDQQAGDRFCRRGQLHGQQLPVEQALRGGRVPQGCLCGGGMVAGAVL